MSNTIENRALMFQTSRVDPREYLNLLAIRDLSTSLRSTAEERVVEPANN